jgi:hypothetical protein
MVDGTIYTHHQYTRHGDPDEPLTDQELLDKFEELAGPRVGNEQMRNLSREVMETPDVKIRNLSALWLKMSV